jgi:type III restriction enzyme
MTERTTIDRLIVNSPYEEPQRYWRYNRENRPSLWSKGSGGRPGT